MKKGRLGLESRWGEKSVRCLKGRKLNRKRPQQQLRVKVERKRRRAIKFLSFSVIFLNSGDKSKCRGRTNSQARENKLSKWAAKSKDACKHRSRASRPSNFQPSPLAHTRLQVCVQMSFFLWKFFPTIFSLRRPTFASSASHGL